MKKIFRIFIISIISFAVMLSSVACGCNGGTDEVEKITETDIDLVKDGKTEYTVIYPAKPSTSFINTSVSELTLFFEKATGITLKAEADNADDVVWQKSAKYISLGETEILAASGADKGLDRDTLKQTGYAIRNAGNSVFLIGGKENGVLNAVYRFLKEQFHFECYATDEIVLDTEVKNEKLLSYENVKSTPDIAFHTAAQNETMLDQLYARRLGMTQLSDWIMGFGGDFTHNWFGIIPPSVWRNVHSDWFSPNGKQLCLTRDKEGLAKEVLSEIIKVLQKNPDGYVLPFCQMDDGGWCDCDECKACSLKYGADSASLIIFMNYLWDLLDDWLKVNMPERQVYFYVFAYQSTEKPPVADANGNIPEEMKLNDHTYVQYAPIYAAGYYSYGHTSQDKTDNSSSDNMIKGWQKVTDKFMFWRYTFYYKGESNMLPYYDFSNLKETFNYIKDMGTDYLFVEDHSGKARNWSDWSRLKIYLRSKLAWDTDADLLSYTDAFFKNYFKSASGTMRQLFDEYSSHFSSLIADNALRGQGGEIDILEQSYWPKDLLDRWMRHIEKAFKDIEYLKDTDEALYDKLEKRIRLESISLRALCERLYGSCIYVGNGNTLLEDCRQFGIGFMG